MSYQTNPIILRTGITAGWHQSLLIQEKTYYTANFVFWFKLYLFIKNFLKKNRMLLISFEIRASNFNIMLLYLNVQVGLPRLPSIKLKTIRRSKILRGDKMLSRSAFLFYKKKEFFLKKPKKFLKIKPPQLSYFNLVFLSLLKSKVFSNGRGVFVTQDMRKTWFYYKNQLDYGQSAKNILENNIKKHKIKVALKQLNNNLNMSILSQKRHTFAQIKKYRKYYKYYNQIKYLKYKYISFRFKKLKKKYKSVCKKRCQKFFSKKISKLRLSSYPFALQKFLIKNKIRAKIKSKLKLFRSRKNLVKNLVKPLNFSIQKIIVTAIDEKKREIKKELKLPKNLSFKKIITRRSSVKYVRIHKIPLWNQYFWFENYFNKILKHCFKMNIVVKFQQLLERLVSTTNLIEKIKFYQKGNKKKFSKFKNFNRVARSLFNFHQYGNLYMIAENIVKLLERNRKQHLSSLRAMNDIIYACRPLYIRGYSMEVFGKINARTRARSFKKNLSFIPLHVFDARVDAVRNYASAKTGSFGVYFTTFMGWSRV